MIRGTFEGIKLCLTFKLGLIGYAFKHVYFLIAKG